MSTMQNLDSAKCPRTRTALTEGRVTVLRVVMIVVLSAVAVATGGGNVLALASSGAADGDDSFPWPVAIIGGAVIVGGLIAVRGEFRNWRQRRSDRA